MAHRVVLGGLELWRDHADGVLCTHPEQQHPKPSYPNARIDTDWSIQ